MSETENPSDQGDTPKENTSQPLSRLASLLTYLHKQGFDLNDATRYSIAFDDHKVDVNDLPLLTDDDLENVIGMKEIGYRLKLKGANNRARDAKFQFYWKLILKFVTRVSESFFNTGKREDKPHSPPPPPRPPFSFPEPSFSSSSSPPFSGGESE